MHVFVISYVNDYNEHGTKEYKVPALTDYYRRCVGEQFKREYAELRKQRIIPIGLAR